MVIRQEATIRNKMGMHVRPATRVAEIARKFKSEVFLIKEGQKVDAKSCIELLTLAAVMGTRLEVEAEGEDAQDAASSVARLINSGFEEL